MKQVVVSDVVAAFRDEPTTIGDRLETLGLTRAEINKLFSKEIIETEVYASSFAKFLQDNGSRFATKIPAEQIADDWVNPFSVESNTVGERLGALGIAEKDVKDMFDKKTLDLSLSGGEFQNFIVKNQKKFLGKLENLSTQGG